MLQNACKAVLTAAFGAGCVHAVPFEPMDEDQPGQRNAEVELFTGPGLTGTSKRIGRDIRDFVEIGFNDRAQSARIVGSIWELCGNANYGGTCRIYGPGDHADLGRGLRANVSSARLVEREPKDGRYGGSQAAQGQGPAVELFSGPAFSGGALMLDRDVASLSEFGFDNRVGSIVVHHGEWQFCEYAAMHGHCISLGPGRYPRLGTLGQAITSVRRVR